MTEASTMKEELAGDDAAKRLAEAEEELARAKAKVAELRRSLPPLAVEGYALRTAEGGATTLDELFGDRSELLLIHNMGKSCPYCTLWADGFNGVAHHLEQRAALALESPDPPEVQRAFAEVRGWRMRVVSSRGTSLKRDLGVETADGALVPGVSALRREPDGTIRRVGQATFGPGDDFCSVWHLLALLPDGAGDWQPRVSYEASGA